MSISSPDSLDRNDAPDEFSQYNSIFTSINVPSSSPNSCPENVQIFSLKSAVRYAFYILQASISSSFNAAIVKDIMTESLETTNDNVIEEGDVVVCPPPTRRAFLLKCSYHSPVYQDRSMLRYSKLYLLSILKLPTRM